MKEFCLIYSLLLLTGLIAMFGSFLLWLVVVSGALR